MPQVIQTVPIDPNCKSNKFGPCPKIQEKNKGLSEQVRKSKSVKVTLNNDVSKMRNIDQK